MGQCIRVVERCKIFTVRMTNACEKDMMLEIGSIIDAVVVRSDVSGVFLTHDGNQVFVPAPEVSWAPDSPIIATSNAIGMQLRVLILHFNYRDNFFVGSIRRIDQRGNPYRQLSKMDPRTVFNGHVVIVLSDFLIVEIDGGAWGQAPRTEFPEVTSVGASVRARIDALDVNAGLLRLRST